MKYAAYNEYKQSKIEWLGKIPQHWEIWKIAHGFKMTGSGTTPPSDNPDWYEGDVCWVTTGELRETVITDTEKKISQEALKNFSALKVFPEGALAMAMYGATIGRLGIFGVAATTNQACAVLFGQKAFDTKFVFYWLQAFREQIILLASGGGQPNISQEKVRSIRIACPSIEEQQTIAHFLDAKTAQLDELIAKKRQLIDKLKEKRQALIARTVTRGLPPEAAQAAGLEPNPEMRDSGVEWLGEIPVHWECKPIKYLSRIGNGSTPARDNSDYWEDGFFPWLNSAVVNQEMVTESDEFVTHLALKECHLPIINPPAVLVGITGQGRTRGMATTLLLNATINQHVAYIKPNTHLADVHFIRLVFDNAYAYLRSESDGGGSTKGAITCDQIANLVVPVPPIEEQLAITAFVKAEATRIVNLTTNVETAINRLTEYRQALITSAVTGKIDVRSWQADGDAA